MPDPPPAAIDSPNVGSLRRLDGGYFTMGSSNPQDNIAKLHTVRLSDFYIGEHEIMQGQYTAVMSRPNPSNFTQGNIPAPAGETADRRPVEMVNWYDAIVFCNTLSMLEGVTPVYTVNGSTDPATWPAVPADVTGAALWGVSCDWEANGYRLPTEAEWEYACRAGTETAYSTGDTISAADAWYKDSATNNATHEVKKTTANGYGLYDMHGNVWEWCWDWYDQYDARANQTNPRGPDGNYPFRVLRGGCFRNTVVEGCLRSTFRFNHNPWHKSDSIGFRLVRLSAD